MLIARTRDALDQITQQLRRTGNGIALVPTMGALHAGHLALLKAARAEIGGGAVAASIFVNPLQFAPGEDLARYPRDEAGDLAALEHAGCDVVWLPDAQTMYPPGDTTMIDVTSLAALWEGAARPGHFRGVATVVAKLFGQTRAACAVFGEKDFQQLQVIRRMVTDLALPVRIVGVATQREADGLAMSSRNRFLTPEQRARAPLLHTTLLATRSALLNAAQTDPGQHETLLAAARSQLTQAGFGVDYLQLVDGETLLPTTSLCCDARLLAAARLGTVRLLDNIAAA